jgi:AP-4 complex subunit sigma-1
MFNIEKAHFIVDEFLCNGCVLDANRNNCLSPINIIDSQKS